ncbi:MULTISPECIES: hypothetical protein [unclassified Mycobacterium]|uniref:hypothetical protein n=1 Tax=unclassified Mycobacterium TaxID=2642494 RepID=UPI0029C6DF22|nr:MULTISPECIES: hypothetical protein [unclassified Mycobacterium]
MRSVKTAAVAATFAFAYWGAAGVAHADPPPAPPPAPKTTIDADGLYTVGKDIAPGNYSSAGPVGDGTCSWRRADAAGTTIDNAISHKAQIIAIAPTDATFKTRGCQAWALTDAAPPAGVGNLQAQILLGALNGLAGGMGQAPAAPAPAPAAPPTP